MTNFALNLRASICATTLAPILFLSLCVVQSSLIRHEPLTDLFKVVGGLVVVTAVFCFFISMISLLFLHPLFRNTPLVLSSIIIVIVGATVGSILILWPSFAIRGVHDEAIKTVGGTIEISFPYTITGAACAFAAWYYLYLYSIRKLMLSK